MPFACPWLAAGSFGRSGIEFFNRFELPDLLEETSSSD
jgi:hypothetical protein